MTISSKNVFAPRDLNTIEREMARAHNYSQWLAVAQRHDRQTGADQWRQDHGSVLYDYANLEGRLATLRDLRERRDDHGLLFVLNEGIHGNMAGMGNAGLYQRAKCGTKHLIESYINEVSNALEYLSRRDLDTVPWADRIDFFQRASHCYGLSALMLSGGGTLGYFHFGVLKVLIEQSLCPVVISGASAGAFVAAIVGTRSDDEYLALFEDNFLARELTANRGDLKIGFGKNNLFVRGGGLDRVVIPVGWARTVGSIIFLQQKVSCAIVLDS